LICGSGIGVSIIANRHKHIRASLCHNAQTAKMTRKHNNSNVICLKGRPFVKKIFLLCSTPILKQNLTKVDI
jgi:ribose 5-phosphate isomerase B